MPTPQFVDIIFGPLEPDWGGMPRPEAPGYLVYAYGVRSTPNGYRGMPIFENVTNATAACASSSYGRGFNLRSGSTNSFFYIANPGGTYGIFESRAEGTDTWETVTPGAGAAVTPFCSLFLFSGDAILVSSTRAPIKKTMSDSHATDFSDLAGSPPTAACGNVIGQHVVLGNLSTDAFGVRTSAIGNHEDWPTPGTADARSKQSIYESLTEELGPVRAIIPGQKFGIVMQTTGIQRMTYVGGSQVFTFDVIDHQYGIGDGDIPGFSTDGKFWYWQNESGVFSTDGFSVRCLSEGKIDEALFTNTITHPEASTDFTGSSGYDSNRGLVMFTNVVGSLGRHLAYNVIDGNFTFANSVANNIFEGFATATSTRKFLYSVLTSSQKLQKFNSSGSNIVIDTAFIEIDPGYRVQVHGAHPLGADLPSTLTMSQASAETLDDIDVAGSYSALTAASRGLRYTGRADAPFFAFRIAGNGVGESRLIRGIRVFYERTGPQQ